MVRVASLLAVLAGCVIPQQAPPPDALFETQGAPVEIAEFDESGALRGVVARPALVKNRAGWKRVLTPVQFAVLREGVTEAPDPAADHEPFPDGIYRCAGCGSALFDSRDRFVSGSGWPAFAQPLAAQNVESRWDSSWGVRRRQVLCRLCGGTLGHVFKDGPRAPTYLRYCINPSAMQFRARTAGR